MSRKLKNLLIFLITLLWVFPSNAADKKKLFRDLKQHEARALSTWHKFTGKDIKDRILPAPDIIIDYLRKDNQFQGYKERPRKPEIDAEFYSDIVMAVVELPESVRSHIHEHVIAVFLVEELGGSAYAELLRDFDNNKMGFIVLDVGSLNRKANEWASWRENSPFAWKGQYVIEAEIEQKTNDHRMSAIQYIFLHELGHLIGVAKKAHPHWFRGGHPQNWPFTKLSWLSEKGGFKGKSKFDDTFTNRRKIKFYSFKDASLTSKEIDETYAQFLKTDFVSLYAATNMYDDFAETYAMYVHVVLQDRPWKIKILKEGQTSREITNPIMDKRCETKKKCLDSMFQ